MNCPDENVLSDLLAGRLGDRREAIEPHLVECRECRAVVSALAREIEMSPANVVTMHGQATFEHLPGRAADEAPPEKAVLTFTGDERVADRYRIVRFVASGGMGEVYEAEDLELHHRIALKAIRPHIAAEPRVIERFKREIMFARKVTHPNVCRIFDVGFHTRADGERVTFLTMELLEGETLAVHLQRHGRMSPDDVLPLVEQMASALTAAHSAGVIHRDLKSANVMLVSPKLGEPGPRAVITDFGLARGVQAADPADPQVSTEQRELVGTPAYMAPEQVALLEVGASADIYALGVVLYEMLTGKLPFVGETPMLTAVKRLHEPAPSPRVHAPDVSLAWERVVLRCLERAPGDRYPRVGDVPAALRSRELTPSPYLGRVINNHVLRRQIDDSVAPLFVAEHAQIDRRVAVQIFPPQFDAQAVQRCFADAATASALHHAHIVELLDFGPLPEGGAYLMSEWLTARSLAALLRVEKTLSLPRAMHIAHGVAEALDAAHKKKLVHGGLTSSLLFLTERNDDPDFVKIRGFGLAQLSGAQGKTAVDARSDVRALGALVYEMLTGRPPEPSYKDVERSLAALDLPPPVEDALREALHEEPARRPSSVMEVIAALEEPPSQPQPKLPPRAYVPATPLSTGEHPPLRSPVPRVVFGVAIVALIAVAFIALRPRPEASAPPIVTPAPVVAAPKPTPAPTPAPARSDVRVAIRALPTHAELTLDGDHVSNPYTFTLPPREDREHIIVAHAAGYDIERRAVMFDHDMTIELTLSPKRTHKTSEPPLITEYPK